MSFMLFYNTKDLINLICCKVFCISNLYTTIFFITKHLSTILTNKRNRSI
ncbi:hypothetical protein XFF6991_580008 [Xanthomonas phaseoli pv. phaseoli]|uniref:Uncharacterized protein n=1 Tax=Xanthomonas campestris pv. phaseoli TaxID=317013 RepID=A0A7Z7NJY4_XANCH|nr:hypothetical protein XFF6991_580008 [Xanthomonas phaseoli pv. phaseoli]